MTLTLKWWNKILNTVKLNNSNEDGILEQIKAKLREQDEGTYQEWEQKGFNINHLFTITTDNGQTDEECTLLHLAVQNSHKDVVQALLDKGANVDEKKADGWTPLHIAALNGHKDVVQALLDKGADVSVEDIYGKSPLCYATKNRHDSIVKLLEAREAKLRVSEVEKSKCDRNAQGSYPGKNNPAPRNAKSELPEIAASILAITGVAAGIAIAVYLEMPAVGIAVGACCLIAAVAIIYYCNRPPSSLEKSSPEAVRSAEKVVA